MSLHKLVHCHLCPLKDHCTFSAKESSWRWHNQGRKRFSEKADGLIRIIVEEGDLGKLMKATSNCPLRRAVAYTETIQAKKFLKWDT